MTEKNPPRRKPYPSDGEWNNDGTGTRRPFGDDPCFVCGKPGSTCPDCGEVICFEHDQRTHTLPAGHQPVDHLEPLPPPPEETEDARLVREIGEMDRVLRVKRLRERHAALKKELEADNEDARLKALDLVRPPQ